MHILSDQSAINFSTFRFEQTLRTVIEFESVSELQQYTPTGSELILGEGSNTVFLSDIMRSVCRYVASDKRLIALDQGYYLLHAEGGHNWHQLVEWSVRQNLWGLENLALIPGSAGAAPVQNIGAYGVEFADRCLYVDFYQWQDREVHRLTASQCHFAYRDSIFKQVLAGKGIIVAVGLLLQTQRQPVLNYKGLDHLPASSSIQDIYQQVIDVRSSKLPDPALLANCGSFFKNPLISSEHFQRLQQLYPQIPGFKTANDSVKVPAAWFIDQQGFKGYRFKDVGCYPLQPLVLVNYGSGTSEQLLKLKSEIQDRVLQVYQVFLEPEVRLIEGSSVYEQK